MQNSGAKYAALNDHESYNDPQDDAICLDNFDTASQSRTEHDQSETATLVGPPDLTSLEDTILGPSERTIASIGRQPRRKSLTRRFGVAVAACIANTVCLTNLILAIWASASFHPFENIGTAYDGDCNTTSKTALWLHLLINIISSVLLSASSYCMQCLNAPTRAECDSAHARQDWLSIGVLSTRNLFKISRVLASLWIVLALSSLPIHLLYNLVVFKTLSARDYTVFAVNSAFLDSGETYIPDLSNIITPIDECTLTGQNRSFSLASGAEMDTLRSLCHLSDCFGMDQNATIHSNVTLNEITLSCGNDSCPVVYKNGSTMSYNWYGSYNTLRRTNESHFSWDLAFDAFSSCSFADCTIDYDSRYNRSIKTFGEVLTDCFDFTRQSDWTSSAVALQDKYLTDPDSFRKMSLAECFRSYGTDFVSDWGDVVLVTANSSNSSYSTAYGYSPVSTSTSYVDSAPYYWICESAPTSGGHDCDVQASIASASQFTYMGMSIDHCVAQRVENAHCKLQFSVTMLTVVIICNALKAAAMITTLFLQQTSTLTMVGDAIASYLDSPDPRTKDQCLLTHCDVRGQSKGNPSRVKQLPRVSITGTVFHRPRYTRWFNAVSGWKWLRTVLLIFVAIVIIAVLLDDAVRGVNSAFGDAKSPYSLGFGAVSSRMLINIGLPTTGVEGLTASVLIANLPQVIASFVYVACNDLLTSMLLGYEWSGFAAIRKSLRVSTLSGQPRSTHYLHLPFKYSVPLLIISATLHWLISEAIFLVRVDIYADDTDVIMETSSRLGYSPLPILLVLLLALRFLVAAIALSCRGLQSNMPIAPPNSYAIAAACHRPAADVDASVLPVKWGEVESMGNEEQGHCCFTSF